MTVVQISHCCKGQRRLRNEDHMQQITADVSSGLVQRKRGHPLARHAEHRRRFPRIARGHVPRCCARYALVHFHMSGPILILRMFTAMFKTRWQRQAREKFRNFQKSLRWCGAAQCRTGCGQGGRLSGGSGVKEAEMNSDNFCSPTAACAEHYNISSESSFTEESADEERHCRRKICLLLLNTF